MDHRKKNNNPYAVVLQLLKRMKIFLDNLPQPKLKVLALVFDQYFKTSLEIDKRESNYTALQPRCYLRPIVSN